MCTAFSVLSCCAMMSANQTEYICKNIYIKLFAFFSDLLVIRMICFYKQEPFYSKRFFQVRVKYKRYGLWRDHMKFLFLYSKTTFNIGFESRRSHLNFRFCACFEQGVPWHSGNYRVWIYYETRTWHDKNSQINFHNLSYWVMLKNCEFCT